MTTETLVYRNPLLSAADVADWIAEGPVQAADAEGAVELRSAGGPDDHFTFWCPEEFGDRIRVSWDFSPTSEPGLAMLFFGASSVAGGGIFEDGLAPRDGAYPQYHSGDIRTLHVSYFRRRWEDERAFHTCNLRKSPGFHLVAQGADPLPPVVDARGTFYRIDLVKDGADVRFAIDGLPLFAWTDDETTGPRATSGRIGFRQMAPLVARYRNLEVHALS
ncbi:YesU family protein [Microbacterium sp. G2-8]|uniref:YesU family protein n=1 Tax=Microbacterium sp. G2-8 TaxID=2842454 RepID=UPI0021AAFF6E|nr:YesU family protein [Microbacterium sp. G2-8]